MSQQPEKSPLPWRVVPPEMDGGEMINGASVHDANGRAIYTVDCGDCNMLDEPTAEFIVRACNNHEALLDALRAFCGDHEAYGFMCAGLNTAYKHALTVIKKAEGVPHVTA